MNKKVSSIMLTAIFSMSFASGMPIYVESMETSTENPVIWSDVPDPDIIRVGDAYYMTSTTMHMNPGVPIMKSYDLVNWEIVNYVYDILADGNKQTLSAGENAYGKGSWASSIKYNNGKFYIVFGAYDTNKTYIYQTEDIENGPWTHSELEGVYRDPSILFDDDGSVYLVHGGGDIRVTELTEDATAVKEGGLDKVIIEDASSVAGTLGNGLVAEGTHIQKINGKYYIFNIVWPEGGIRTEIVHRADSIDGEYEGRIALSQKNDAGIAQGGIVDSPDGKWYGMLFEDHGAVGRTPYVVPVTWEDEWPIFGDIKDTGISVEKLPYGFVSSDEFYQGEKKAGYSHFTGNNEAQTLSDEISTYSNIEVGQELLDNVDMENGVEPWIGNGTAAVEISNEYYYSGANGLYTTNRTATGDGPKQMITGKVEAGATYEFSAKVLYENGPDEKQFNYDIQNGPSWQGIKIMGSNTLSKGEWGTIEGTYKVPEDADTSETFIFLETPWTGTPDSENDLMNFYVDDVSFKLKEAPIVTGTKNNGENDYNGSNLNLAWQWNHNPDNNNWSLTERAGYLRLTTGSISKNILDARNTLTQRTYGPECSGKVALEVGNMKDGDYAGLGAFQNKYGFVGVKMEGGAKYLVMVNGSTGNAEEIASIPLEQDRVYLKADFDYNNRADKANFYYSLDGSQWEAIGNTLKMEYTLPHFMGYRFALFNYATEKTGGYVDFDYFRLEDELNNSVESNTLNAELGNIDEITGVPNEEFEIPVTMDELPAGNYTSLAASFNIPKLFTVTDIDFNEDNIEGDTTYSYLNNQLKLEVKGEAVNYSNNTNDRLFATIKLKVNNFVTADKTETITTDYLKVSDGQANYKVDNMNANIELKFLDSGALAKLPGYNNPLISHKIAADPCAMVYDGRVYVYMSSEGYEYDEEGNITPNTFSEINKIRVISSDDMVNWTDHGDIPVAGLDNANDGNGIAAWAKFSWAPTAAHKVIDGKDKFFLYFANSGGGIGVLTADSPIGPWTDPIGEPLVKWSSPGVSGVVWLFDPAVLVDDDGTGYLYFGGGVPANSEEQVSSPKTARVVKLGDDMVSLDGAAQMIDAPYMFEDSGIHKYNGKYYYSYCINFSGAHPSDKQAGRIAYMTSDNPMGPFTYENTFLNNPSEYFGIGGNNHHSIFEFKDKWYVVYHAQTLSYASTGSGNGYRSPHINELKYYENGKIKNVKGDMEGVDQIDNLNPYERVEAETMAWNAGIVTENCASAGKPVESVNLDVTEINNGDWTSVSKANFGTVGENNVTTFKANVASVAGGKIEVYLDSLIGKCIGTVEVPSTGGEDIWQEVACTVENVEGVHNIFFKFTGEEEVNLFKFDYWQFATEAVNPVECTFKYKLSFGGVIKGKFLQKVQYGEEGSEVTAKPILGYHFVSWSDGVLTATRKDTNLGKDIEVKAIFEKDSKE